MKFESTIVGKEFIEHRDKLASDLKGENTTFRADFEWPEWWMGYYIPEITGHKLCHHYSYDTTHPEWGKCEFKYLPKNGLGCCVITDKDYPQRVAFVLSNNLIRSFLRKNIYMGKR